MKLIEVFVCMVEEAVGRMDAMDVIALCILVSFVTSMITTTKLTEHHIKMMRLDLKEFMEGVRK